MGVKRDVIPIIGSRRQALGLIACHHYSPRNVPLSARLLIYWQSHSNRIAAIEKTAPSTVIQVRRLEQRRRATDRGRDWRLALFRILPLLFSWATGRTFYDGSLFGR
jgi:light-regulated signal transduction histidine kinase (bacteriophytochrome)